jgi:hypothetical protein
MLADRLDDWISCVLLDLNPLADGDMSFDTPRPMGGKSTKVPSKHDSDNGWV